MKVVLIRHMNVALMGTLNGSKAEKQSVTKKKSYTNVISMEGSLSNGVVHHIYSGIFIGYYSIWPAYQAECQHKMRKITVKITIHI